jgi:predicted ATPase/class 3 adenylate cyclase
VADRLGQQFGNYRLVSLLGQGGYAAVYLGQHLRLNLQAAIKVLHTHLTGQEASHFQQEAETIAALMHPAIVRILDFDVQQGVPFLIMDYAPNGSLRQYYPKGSLVPSPQIVSSVKQVASALQYAHERKFIHRDVKPENMLLGRQEEVLLSDFGLAALSHSSASLSTQEAIGTLPYMAPEQIEGHPRAASDQYALGVVVYEWLCGARPFEGTATEVMVQQLTMPPPPLRERIPTIPLGIEQVVLKALAKDPKARFASVKDFAAALERASQRALAPTGQQASEQPATGSDDATGYETVTVAPGEMPVTWTTESAVGELERRLVTVLSCDLVGFTSLSEQLDLEDMHEILGMYFGRMSQLISRFGGSIKNYAGDTVVALFGVPVVHEDDALRAVRCGLSMQAAIQEVSAEAGKRWGVELALRVSVNTGEVVSGIWDVGDRKDHAVSGDAVNRAARLQALAEPGEVLVGEETMWLARREIRFSERGTAVLKGKAGIVPVYTALEARQQPGGWEERGQHLPLVGRTTELTVLESLWTKIVQEQRPHLVTVLGEPGIGKSRLVAECEGNLPGEALVLHGRCLPYGEGRGYWALAEVVKEAAGITVDDDMETASRKLGELVATVVSQTEAAWDSGEITQHLARLCGLDVERDRLAPLADQRTLQVSVCHFIEALARSQPLCLLFEDLHWADEALLDLIEFIATRVHEVPLLILTQARPEFLEQRPAWGRSLRNCTSLSLEPLDERQGRDLALRLCLERGLAEEVAEQVVRGAAGNPLFAEEMVATIAERGEITGIPSAIRALIAARLDTLPQEERRAMQLAAVIGKVFWDGGLRALGAAGDVRDHLEVLEQKEMLRSHHRSQMRGDREYAFKHDLIRDVAYETLSRADRRLLHQRLVGWIEVISGERVEEYLDLLAHHAFQAGAWEKALEYAERAGEQAQGLYASRTAVEQFTRALEATRHLALSPPPKLYRARGQAHETVGDFEQAQSDYERALEAARAAHDGAAEWQSELDLGFLWTGRDYEQAGVWLRQAVTLAERLNDPIMQAHSLNRLGNWLLNTGHTAEALQAHTEALALFESQQDKLGMATTLNLLGVAHSLSGDSVNSVLLNGRSIELLRVLGDRKTLISSLATCAADASPQDEDFTLAWSLADCERDSAEALRLAREIEWADGEAYVDVISSSMLAFFGQLSAALGRVQQALRIATRIEHQQWITGAHVYLAYIYLLMLAPEEALLHVESGLALAQQVGSAWWIAWLTSNKAQAYLLLGQLPHAEATLQAVLHLMQPPRLKPERRLLRVWAELALAQQQPAVALQRCDQLLQTATHVPGVTDGQPIPLLLKCKGEALMALGRLDEAVQMLEEARRGAIVQQALPALWQIERALGQVYLRLQHEEQAQQAFTAARAAISELAQHIDEIPLREQFIDRALGSLPKQKRASPHPTTRKKKERRENML